MYGTEILGIESLLILRKACLCVRMDMKRKLNWPHKGPGPHFSATDKSHG